MEPIEGGYYLKARCIEESDIAFAPPHIREIWDFFLRNAFWKDGKHLKRGQLQTSYKEIQEALHWKVGYRKERYKKHHCEAATKYLTKHGMIEKARTTRGLIITVCNYAIYQDGSAYENDTKADTRQNPERQGTATIDEEGEERKELKKEERGPLATFYTQFKAVHADCERATVDQFVASVASCRTTQLNEAAFSEAISAAMTDFTLNCASMASFRPQSGIQKWRNYLKIAVKTQVEKKQKKTVGIYRHPSAGGGPKQ